MPTPSENIQKTAEEMAVLKAKITKLTKEYDKLKESLIKLETPKINKLIKEFGKESPPETITIDVINGRIDILMYPQLTGPTVQAVEDYLKSIGKKGELHSVLQVDTKEFEQKFGKENLKALQTYKAPIKQVTYYPSSK